MNNFLTKLSRRERLVVLIAAVVLFVAGVLYPLFRTSETYRQGKLEELDAARSLRASYRTMILNADQIRTENSELKDALSQTAGLLFDRAGNDVMMEASIIKLLNEMAPDLSLDISMSKPSLRAVPRQLSFSVRGNGRYPEILNFFYKLETHRPLIVVDHFNISVQNRRGTSGPFGQSRQLPPLLAAALQKRASADAASAEPSEPRMKLQMELHINCRTAAEGGK
jgi:hypothetical protein